MACVPSGSHHENAKCRSSLYFSQCNINPFCLVCYDFILWQTKWRYGSAGLCSTVHYVPALATPQFIVTFCGVVAAHKMRLPHRSRVTVDPEAILVDAPDFRLVGYVGNKATRCSPKSMDVGYKTRLPQFHGCVNCEVECYWSHFFERTVLGNYLNTLKPIKELV